MKKLNIIGICILFLLVGCKNTINPLDIDVKIIGDANRFHTDFTQSNNSINVTIKQAPSRLIYFPIDYNLLNKNGIFKIECFNRIYEKVFEANMTQLWYDGYYLEKQPDYNTIIKYPILNHYRLFDINKLNYTNEILNCRIRSNFNSRYIEYIDGVQVENTTNYCNYFWHDFSDFNIDCRDYPRLRCSYQFSSNEQQKFFDYPSIYIMNKCFNNE